MCLELEAGKEDAGRKTTEEKENALHPAGHQLTPDSKHAASLHGESRGFASVPGKGCDWSQFLCIWQSSRPSLEEVCDLTTSCLTIGNRVEETQLVLSAGPGDKPQRGCMGEPLVGLGRDVWESCSSLLGKQNSTDGKWVSGLVSADLVCVIVPNHSGWAASPAWCQSRYGDRVLREGPRDPYSGRLCTIMNAHLRKCLSPHHPGVP